MTRFFKHTIAALALAALTLPGPVAAQDAAPQTASPNEILKATHGDWEIVCSTAQEGLCVMRQFGKNAEGEILIDVRIRKLEGATSQDGKSFPAAIQITTPLGTILGFGVTVKVDAGESRTGAFEVCIRGGCIIRDPMSEEFLADLKAGKTANMTFSQLQLGTVSVSISLKGFTKAFKAL
ncbi:MAG: invasion associated locus B family protein [Proteobacteria bacterium]|nr:invasion associated locus B family protein [Pseudomonadota bacterium]MCH8953133.1 invasion associated locus B family protein [Pseudomonadota bacterium]